MLVKNDTTKKHYFNGAEITEIEYSNIMQIIKNRPTAPDGFGYRLTDSFEWELYEVPSEDGTDDNLTAEEALSIIIGGAT